MLRILLAVFASAVAPATARASCHDDAVRIELGAGDEATGAALRTLLGEPEASPGWLLTVAGPRSEVRHRATGERYARTLPPDSSAYERALAALELLGAARAACTDRGVTAEARLPSAPEAAPVPSPPGPSACSMSVVAAARFDGEVDGPWMLRPSLALELGFARDGDAPHPFVGVEAAVLGLYERSARDQALAVRYERHDAALRLGVGLPIDRLTVLLAASIGVTLRDVTGIDEGAAVGHRLDVGAILGTDVQLRIALIGPLGLRVAGGLSFVPEVGTYRAAGAPVVTEQGVRMVATVGLDLEVR